MFCRQLWTLRRRCCPRSVLLVGVALCLFYQTLVVARSRLKASPTVSNLPNKSLEPDGQLGQLLRKHPERLNSLIGELTNESTNVSVEACIFLFIQCVYIVPIAHSGTTTTIVILHTDKQDVKNCQV